MDYLDYFGGGQAPADDVSAPSASPSDAMAKRAYLSPQQAQAMAHQMAADPTLSNEAHKLAMLHALNMKQEPKYTTGAGGFFGALAQALGGAKERQQQDKYDAALASNVPTDEESILNSPAVRRLLGLPEYGEASE
jgi:hypothetical protein